MQLPLRALLVVRAFELWVHENDIRLAAGQPLAVPGPSVLSLMTRLAATLLPGAAVRAGVPGPGRLHLVLTGPGGGTWDLEWDPERDPETASAARPGPAGVSIIRFRRVICVRDRRRIYRRGAGGARNSREGPDA